MTFSAAWTQMSPRQSRADTLCSLPNLRTVPVSVISRSDLKFLLSALKVESVQSHAPTLGHPVRLGSARTPKDEGSSQQAYRRTG